MASDQPERTPEERARAAAERAARRTGSYDERGDRRGRSPDAAAPHRTAATFRAPAPAAASQPA